MKNCSFDDINFGTIRYGNIITITISRYGHDITADDMNFIIKNKFDHDGKIYVFTTLQIDDEDTSDYGYDGYDERWITSSAPILILNFEAI